MSLFNELKQLIYSLPLKMGKSRRDKIAHFCKHRGIYIEFTPARTAWYAIAPSAVRPWWIKLKPLKTVSDTKMNNKINTNKEEIEALENA